MSRKQPAFFFPEECDPKLKNDTARALKRSRRGASKAVKKVFDCSTCELYKHCRSPKMEMFGRGEKGILIVGQCPGKSEDRDGIPFIGKSGVLLKNTLADLGIDLDRDCIRTNAVQCYPGSHKNGRDKDPTEKQIKCCYSRLVADIKEVKPKLIICLGTPALKSILKLQTDINFNVSMMHGLVVPYHEFGAWVGSVYHPSFFLHRKGDDYNPDDSNLFLYDLARCIKKLDKSLPLPLDTEGNLLITDPDEAVQQLEYYSESVDPVAFDFETNCLSAYAEGADIKCVQLSNNIDSAVMIPMSMKNPKTGEYYFNQVELSFICSAFRKFLLSPAPKVVQGINMEGSWSMQMFGVEKINNYIHDTMIGQHVVCSNSKTKLDFQAILMRGHAYKGIVDIADFDEQELDKLVNYGCWDARYTLMAYYRQVKILKSKDRLRDFMRLYHDGSDALVKLKHRGVRIDRDILDSFYEKYKDEQDKCVQAIRNNPEVKKYELASGKSYNPDSWQQVSAVVYNGYGIDPPSLTSSGGGSTDETALTEIINKTKNREVRDLLTNILRFRKTCSATERALSYQSLVDLAGYVHSNFNLFRVATYRSSSNDPNLQNVFKHDDELSVFRECIIPLDGYVFLECDYGSLEVRIIAMGSGDSELIRQLKEGVDMHRRWAAIMYDKPEDEITKEERYETKNCFVFASFYGSKPEPIARNMPQINRDHVFDVQRMFWEEYAGIKEWQERNMENYLKYGYLEGFSGFRANGPLSFTQLYNYPIQGPAFHLLLNGLSHIERGLVNGKFSRMGIQTVPIIQVHDSITFNSKADEIPTVVPMVDEVMVKKYFDWQRDVPLILEWEVGRNWYDMGELAVRECEKCEHTSAQKMEKKKEDGILFKEFDCMECGHIEKVVINSE